MIFPRNDLKKQEILQKIMKDFNENKSYTEEEVGNVIRKHFDDWALIRRELVNFGYMSRDSYKNEYKVLKKELSKDDLERLKKLNKELEKIRWIQS